MDNIYSCSGEKGRRDFCFEHGTLLFRTRGGIVFFRRTPFRLFVPRFCSPGQLIPSFSSLLTHPLPSWRFSPGEINGRVSSQRPLQSNRGLFRESQEGRFTGSEELEETHKYPMVEARLQLAASSIGVKLQGVRSSRQAPELLPIENQPHLLRKTP